MMNSAGKKMNILKGPKILSKNGATTPLTNHWSGLSMAFSSTILSLNFIETSLSLITVVSVLMVNLVLWQALSEFRKQATEKAKNIWKAMFGSDNFYFNQTNFAIADEQNKHHNQLKSTTHKNIPPTSFVFLGHEQGPKNDLAPLLNEGAQGLNDKAHNVATVIKNPEDERYMIFASSSYQIKFLIAALVLTFVSGWSIQFLQHGRLTHYNLLALALEIPLFLLFSRGITPSHDRIPLLLGMAYAIIFAKLEISIWALTSCNLFIFLLALKNTAMEEQKIRTPSLAPQFTNLPHFKQQIWKGPFYLASKIAFLWLILLFICGFLFPQCQVTKPLEKLCQKALMTLGQSLPKKFSKNISSSSLAKTNSQNEGNKTAMNRTMNLTSLANMSLLEREQFFKNWQQKIDSKLGEGQISNDDWQRAMNQIRSLENEINTGDDDQGHATGNQEVGHENEQSEVTSKKEELIERLEQWQKQNLLESSSAPPPIENKQALKEGSETGRKKENQRSGLKEESKKEKEKEKVKEKRPQDWSRAILFGILLLLYLLFHYLFKRQQNKPFQDNGHSDSSEWLNRYRKLSKGKLRPHQYIREAYQLLADANHTYYFGIEAYASPKSLDKRILGLTTTNEWLNIRRIFSASYYGENLPDKKQLGQFHRSMEKMFKQKFQGPTLEEKLISPLFQSEP